MSASTGSDKRFEQKHPPGQEPVAARDRGEDVALGVGAQTRGEHRGCPCRWALCTQSPLIAALARCSVTVVETAITRNRVLGDLGRRRR
ncbi:hypothetical protein AB4305_31345 [Nocardia sp. 2YAB30]|uniref:hypothetical protein n=1 Tax=unclassified Nocardia TaxID=2637762 RepID=UPI003F964764